MEFQEVYDLYFQDVYKYVLSLCRDPAVAEEVTQETFFKAMKGIDSFRGQCRLYVWLCQIAKNTYFTQNKKRGRMQQKQEAASGEDLETRLLEQETAFEIHKVLHALPEPYKEVFSLRVFGELPFQKIGELFGMMFADLESAFAAPNAPTKPNPVKTVQIQRDNGDIYGIEEYAEYVEETVVAGD